MVRYISDQNKVVLLMESGTYGSASGLGMWPGQVMSNDIDESEGLIETRFLGGSSRDWLVMEQGPRDYKGKMTFRMQDLRMFAYAIGSVTTTSGTNMTHAISEINNDVRQSAFTSGTLNPPLSFTMEDSKTVTGTGRNFIRTLNGCIPSKVAIKFKQNEPVTCDVDYIGQILTYSSGATTAVNSNSNRPYLWADATITLGGSVLQTLKEGTLEIDTGVVAPHYANGSRVVGVPFLTNRNYTLDLTVDADSDPMKSFFEQFFLGGSSFNVTLDMNADVKAGVTGSQHAIVAMSGCRLFKPVTPSPNEGVVEQTLTIRPQSVSATVYDRVSFSGVGYGAW